MNNPFTGPNPEPYPVAPPLPQPRPEMEVLEELYQVNNRAKRMPYNARNYAATHTLINDLLDELEAARNG